MWKAHILMKFCRNWLAHICMDALKQSLPFPFITHDWTVSFQIHLSDSKTGMQTYCIKDEINKVFTEQGIKSSIIQFLPRFVSKTSLYICTLSKAFSALALAFLTQLEWLYILGVWQCNTFSEHKNTLSISLFIFKSTSNNSP